MSRKARQPRCRPDDVGVYYPDRKARHHIGAAAAARQKASGDHNRRGTPLFATSIERRALAKPLPEGEKRIQPSVDP